MLTAPEGFEQADGEVAEGGHGAGCGACVEGGSVLGVGHVSHVVQGLDGPVAADGGGEFGRGGLVGVKAGDGIDGLATFAFAGLFAAPVDAEGKAGVGEGAEFVGDAARLDGAGLPAAVSGRGSGVLDGDVRPGQGGELP
jgi:hypothetical protein